ncbi:hypothetical protein [Parasedimentitalea psychrophila]|uniref:Uncharacterized protein n=1 Tax=Parasedimentitalea psychrophila TaxID=2997337 RepID=A0A9Y2P6T9_9RHOB|nr:hypothetical protein [Parasedimentitalea psychrophila]WIY27779.1 hypothetical protein QPJ95_23980 [Parasedimentitalea psychrophila]
MPSATRPNPQRKFIAFILAASIAITGFSAAPARAGDDVAKLLAGLAVLGILGVAINKDRHQRGTVSRRVVEPAVVPVYQRPRPLPPRVTRYDLPEKCLRYFPAFRDGRALLGQKCLRNNYRHVKALPKQCRVTFGKGRRNKSAYKPRCLRRNGYRIVRR